MSTRIPIINLTDSDGRTVIVNMDNVVSFQSDFMPKPMTWMLTTGSTVDEHDTSNLIRVKESPETIAELCENFTFSP